MKFFVKNKTKPAITILSVIAVLAVFSAIYQFAAAQHYKMAVTHGYSRSLAELSDSVRDIGFSLEKGMLVSEPAQLVRLSNEINRSANAAMANLGQLPLSDTELDNTEKFLSQVGDYTNSLAMRVSAGNVMVDEDYANLKNLYSYCDKLYDSLSKMQTSFYDGKLTLERLSDSEKKDTTYLGDSMSDAEKDFVQYPALVYDGPFSAHIDTIEYSALKNLPEVSEAEAKKAAEDFLSGKNYTVKSAGEKGGKRPCYTFEAYPKSSRDKTRINIDVSKQGGKISWFLSSRSPKESNISADEAAKKAAEFLNAHGYTNMKESYYETRSNVSTFNYAAVQDGVVMYPDLVKVKIAMDTGECIGLEASGFLMNNKVRDLSGVAITPEQARGNVSPQLAADSVELCIIPSDGLREILCYEIKGHIGEGEDKKDFLVYVNASTGVQEKVLVLIISDNGVLTV